MGQGVSTGLGVRTPVNEPTCSNAFGKAGLKHPVCPFWAILALVCWEGSVPCGTSGGDFSTCSPQGYARDTVLSFNLCKHTDCGTQRVGLGERTWKVNLVIQGVRKMGRSGGDPTAGTWGSRAQRLLAELGEGGQEGRTGQAAGRPPPGAQATAFVQ